jgi:hypothetical protein
MKLVLFAMIGLALLSAPVLALEDVELVTKERFEKLGLAFRATPSGPDYVRIELDVPLKGELKELMNVQLELRDGWTTISNSMLKEDRTKDGIASVAFLSKRDNLKSFTLRVVQHTGPTRVAHEVLVSDFVDLSKLK